MVTATLTAMLQRWHREQAVAANDPALWQGIRLEAAVARYNKRTKIADGDSRPSMSPVRANSGSSSKQR